MKVYIILYMGICVFGYSLDTALEFWILALCVGICQGGIQALSRSQFGKMIPKKESSEYFGFFDIFGKFADFFWSFDHFGMRFLFTQFQIWCIIINSTICNRFLLPLQI